MYVPWDGAVWWSDVRNNRRLRFDLSTETTTVIAQASNFSNGQTLGPDGSVIVCEQGTRSVVRLDGDGWRQVIADSWHGKRLNSPNDVVLASDGAVWFTDPTYGIDSDEEGYTAESEIGSNNVYRVDPETGEAEALVTSMIQPNGLAFSPDESTLYVSDSGFTHGAHYPRHILRFDVLTGDRGVQLGEPVVFAETTTGLYDGIKVDLRGRVWASFGGGVIIYSSEGAEVGSIPLPEVCANLTFGGDDPGTVFMTATTSLYAIDVDVDATG